MVVYNTAAVTDSLQVGLYVNTGSGWAALQQTPYMSQVWFYMPSFPLNVAPADANTALSVDLWAEYNSQFNNAAANSVVKASNGAPAKPLSKVYANNELYYYVTGYDINAFSSVSISNTGVLSYKVNTSNVSDSTYMNIVFVVK
jgi:hypothetical protein